MHIVNDMHKVVCTLSCDDCRTEDIMLAACRSQEAATAAPAAKPVE